MTSDLPARFLGAAEPVFFFAFFLVAGDIVLTGQSPNSSFELQR